MANQHFYGQTGISEFHRAATGSACLSPNWITTNYNDINDNIVAA